MKWTSNLAIYLLLVNGMIGFAATTGVWADWGVEVAPGVSDQVEATEDAFKDVTTGALGASTLIGVFLTVLNAVQAGWAIVTAAPELLKNIWPALGPIATMIQSVIFVKVGMDVLAAYSGRDI